MTTPGEPMRFALCCRLPVLAALAAVLSAAPALAADAHEDKGAKPAMYVKDGDKFRPATDAEAGAGRKPARAGGERAKREAEALKDALSKEIYEKAVQLAALMAEKALRREVKVEDHRRLLDESLAELKGASKA